MISLQRFLLLAVALVALTTSCRKGPEDPLLSLKSRKARISQNWQAYAYFINGVEHLRKTTVESIDRNDCGLQTLNRYDSLELFRDFRRTGEFRSESYAFFSEQSSIENPSAGICNAFNFNNSGENTEVTTGFWNFTGGVGNTSAREQIFIYEEETQVGLIWDIIRLASDELKLRRRYIQPGQSTFTVEEIWFKVAK